MEYWLESSLKLIDPVRVVCLGEGLAERRKRWTITFGWILIAKEMVRGSGRL